MPIVESSEYEYSREEEERLFLKSLESPKLELASMRPGRPASGHAKNHQSKGAKSSAVEIPSIGDENLPVPSAFASNLSASRSSLPTFDTPASSARQSLDLDLSSDSEVDYESALGTPAASSFSNLVQTHAEPASSSAWTNRSRNLIELDESGSSVAGSSPAVPTADLRGRLQQSRTTFERSISNLKEQASPSSKILAKEASSEIRELVQPRKLYTEHESSPIISNHLMFPDKRSSPHAGSFKTQRKSGAGRDIDDAINSVKGQLRIMESEMNNKRKELERLLKEREQEEAQLGKWSALKRFFMALLFVGLLLAMDLVLRVVITQQQFNLGVHIDFDEITAFYKNYFDLAVATIEDLRAKGTIPF